ncbi:hypothetical protein ANO14919_074650 [Xylariales sp. No.14919]|nr:hypothetical protein ANO14919_074650 [Xylariales sp. No.14919]
MADQDMRLRLVVRRNGLPELRLMWHVHLDSNPTIAKLLEQLNDQVPLESDHWGLEDYVVELHDGDGTDFECLHYQLVRTVLKPDDRVFIRALDHDDHRRRRISGRHQISSDGRHLIDGVPFGRPHLRTTTGRPNIYIPPPKRARLTYSQQDGNDVDRDTEAEASSPVLLLTNGEPYGNKRAATGDFGNLDSDADDTDFMDDGAEPSSPRSSGSELHGDEDEGEDNTDDEIGDESGEDDEDEDEDLDQEVRDLAIENAALEGHDPPTAPVMNLNTLDKLTALRAAFPTAPIDLCEKVLAASKGDLKTTYSVLSEAFNAEMSRAAIITWKPGVSHPGVDLEPSRAPGGTASRSSTRKRKLKEQSSGVDSDHDEDGADNNSLWQKYDHAGFPPGTITSGKGLAHMAAISGSFGNSKTNGNSETTSTTLKAPTEEPIEQDDNDDDDATSSSGSSSGSSTSTDESEDASDEDSSSGNLSSQPSSSDSPDSDSESSDDSVEKPKRTAKSNQHASSSSTSGSDTSDGDSDGESDSGPEELSFRGTSLAATNKESNVSSGSSDDTSDGESTEADSSSSEEEEGDSDDAANRQVLDAKKTTTVQAPVQPHPSLKPTRASLAPIPVPPGAGMEKTKRRNARRRAAKLTKRKMQESHVDDTDAAATEPIQAGTGNGDTINNEAALFEAKRKALLDAIATGGIEVGPSGETTLDHGFVEADRVKRKRTKEGGTTLSHAGDEAAVRMANEQPGAGQEESANQKKRRVDLGAGRRLVFGALGLRNPKNKEDEDKLRDKLQTDARLHATRQPSSQPRPSKEDELVSIDDEQDPDAWKLKINYRAVECCHDNIELSQAPFPFQQRWDPQQQNYPAFKRNKRGGQGKRAQRDQSHYYDDRSSGKKRKRYESYGSADDGYDDTYDKEQDTTIGADVTLNYDDIESQGGDHSHDMVNETSQTTDFDDLPSIPKDVSALPILRPGEAQVGMVISWLKWACSSATSWQPQLSRVAAIVVQVDDDDTALAVCLAKRDRYLDENEKRYDYRTGQRIYDRFEAPDLDEEGEEDDHADTGVDEGYRYVPWAEMNDPRILQQPLDPTIELKPNAKCITSVETDETTTAMENQTKPTVPLVSGQQESDPVASPTEPTDPKRVPTTNEESSPVGDAPKSDSVPEGGLGGSGVEPYVKAASNSTPYQAEQNQPATDLATSDTSQISSPSRQLHETASQAMSSNSPIRNWAPASSIELGESPRPHSSSPTPLPATSPSQLHLEEEFGADIMTGTPKAVLPQAAIPSSSSSIRSGRQPDYAMNADSHGLDPFDATDDLDRQSYDSEDNTPQPARSSLTPIATHRPVTPGSNEQGGVDKATGSSPLATPTSGSLSSLSSLWCTAVTSHSTQSPSRARASSVISKPSGPRFSQDAKYEEAMHKLGEQLDAAPSPAPASSSLEVKREYSTQVPARTLEAISPPPKRRFTLPPNTQVVELSSDSEPAYSEDYADDEIDGTYTPDANGLPKGAGWVKKGRDNRRRKARKSAV